MEEELGRVRHSEKWLGTYVLSVKTTYKMLDSVYGDIQRSNL